MNILVIAPHPDDESFGCGGTIRLHTQRGDRVVIVFLTSGELGLKKLAKAEAWRIREAEATRACEMLDTSAIHFLHQPDWGLGDAVSVAADALRPIAQAEQPQSIFLPHPQEWHPDHQACLPVVQQTYATVSAATARPSLWGYEVWTPMSHHEDVRDITPVMSTKLAAVRCYASQLAGYKYDHAIRGLNRYRGALAAQTRYAEVFCELLCEPGSEARNDLENSI